MKKIISILLVMLIAIAALPITTFAVEIDNNNNYANSSQSSKVDNKVPCYGDYEIIASDNGAKAADPADQYESNNSFFASTRLNNQPSGAPSNFIVSINATLHRQSWLWGLIQKEVDEDYYRLDVFGNANVSVSLTNIPANCDYDLKLFKHDNIRYAEEDDITLIASSLSASNNNESITRVLSPGTYYLWVYSYNDTCNASVNYNLSVSCSYSAQNATISSLRYDKGAKAAIWVSDYDPCGIPSYSCNSKVEVGYISAENPPAAKFQNPYTNYFKSSNPIEQTVLYVWDVGLRNEMRNCLGQLYTTVNAQLQNESAVKMRWEIFDAGTSIGGTTGGVLISFVTTASTAVTIWSGFFTFAPIVVTLLANVFAPSDEAIITKTNLLNYIRDLRTALEVDTNSNGNEVVRISSSYSYSSSSYPGLVMTSYYYDFTRNPQDSYLYSSNNINSWNTSSVVHGTIYGIIDINDIQNAINHGSNYLPDINTSTIRTIQLNSSAPGYLNNGEYHWFRFTASVAGDYSFYTENSIDTFGDLFSSVVMGHSIIGRLDYDDDSGEGNNFRIDYTLTAGQTVYIRVRAYSGYTGNYSFRVSKE